MSDATPPLTLQSVLKQNETMLFSDVGDGKALMDMDKGEYFHYEAVGSDIWELLDGKTDVAEICARLTEDYDVDDETCQNQTLAFLTKLVELGHVQET